MNFKLKAWLGAALAIALCGAPVFGQATTGSLAGEVVLQSDQTALPGAAVEAVHQPTGTRYSATTREDGRFTIPNVRVGGPYQVIATAQGFEPATVSDVYVALGAEQYVNIGMQIEGITETIAVVGSVETLSAAPGASSQVSEETIETLPTVNRSLQDFARTNPYFVVDAQDISATRLNVAGRNNRYNSIQIDGAVNNDLFGLADTGTPGGQTDAQPISLDAIEQLQLVVSPYDVRQGGFTGGGINAVTRSGANTFHGTIFGTQRDADYVGDGPRERPIADFNQDQYGGSVGGRIVQDKLFFFVAGERNTKEQPTGASADGSAVTQFRNPAGAQHVLDVLSSRYGYDAGGLGDFPVETNSDLAFARLDWNATPSTQVTLRHNWVDAGRDVVSDRSSTRFRFPSATYTQADETNSTVAQINSVFGANAFNEGRIGYQTIRDIRSVPVVFPSIEIGGTGPRGGEFIAGTEQFSTANSLDQDVLEITDDFTWLHGAHTFTFGTHNEIFEFANLFLSSAYGYYYFPTMAAFDAGQASQYLISFANGADPRRPTQFEVRQYGLYAGDQWRVSDRLSLTLGLRVDKPDFVDTPTYNPRVEAAIGLSTATVPSEDPIFSPRVGFNWDPVGNGTQQLRGGVGIFSGRTPYVWISNAYGNTGVESTALNCTAPSCTPPPFNPDPANQPRAGAAGSVIDVNLTDPDFEFPRVMRATLGYERQLPWGMRGTVEALYSQTQKDVFYINANRRQNGVSPLDGRPTFTRINTTVVNNVLVLTNTDKGEELTASIQLTRPFSNGLMLTAFYAYQDAESAHDATSSTASSNWGFRHTKGNIFDDDVSRSAFEMENRFNIGATYTFKTGPVGHNVGLYYNAQSGRPYSLMVGGDPNTDGGTGNDLLFVPASADAVIIQNAAGAVVPYSVFADWLAAAGVNPTAGRILDRYELNEPWARTLDFHYAVEMQIGPVSPELTFDITNLLNMIDNEQGVVEFVSNQNFTGVTYRGIDTATGKPIYRESTTGSLTPGSQFTLADTRSRWQARLGLRVSF
jgi:outer membrane receptor protein involved in Fe transport